MSGKGSLIGQVQNHLYPQTDDPELGLHSMVKPNSCCYAIVACTYNCGVELQRGLYLLNMRGMPVQSDQ